MSITASAGLIAAPTQLSLFAKTGSSGELAGSMLSRWYAGSYPAAASAPTPGLNGANLTSADPGAMVLINAASGNKLYLAGIDLLVSDIGNSATGTWVLYDRLWHNSSITATTTTEQGISMSALPARDRNGSSNGEGVIALLEVSGLTGAGGAITNTTIRYTNSAGDNNRTGTLSHVASGGLAAGYTMTFALQAGDKGIKTIEGITLGTTYSSGTMHLVLAREITRMGIGMAYFPERRNAIQLAMPRIFDDSCLYWVHEQATSVSMSYQGSILIVQG